MPRRKLTSSQRKRVRLLESTRSLFPKEAPEVPEGSNLFLNVLREASPLALPSESFTSGGVAAFRRKRTSSKGRASFGKLHLWRFLRKDGLVSERIRVTFLPSSREMVIFDHHQGSASLSAPRVLRGTRILRGTEVFPGSCVFPKEESTQ